ncbi:MAG TPA: glycosyltransferase family 39 protein, partial [Longimicrobiales bacterium]|nr:glycosyltransferase family 39 protein [Longimicrobiales bacterium]
MRADALAVAGLTLAWGAVIALVGVSGDFPLNDDWAYARATRTFLETGRLERVGITWTPLFTHVALGSLFASLFGFSFEVLRACGLFLGWLGMLGAFALCRSVGASALPAALGAAVVGFNPLHLSLAFTFMTDVPFTALATWSLVGWVLGITRRSPVALAAAVVLAVAATLSRQPGAALLVAPAALLVAMRLRRPRVWLVAGAAAALAWTVLAGLPALFGSADQGHLFELGDLWRRTRSPAAFFHVARNALGSLIYLGLFLAPATLCFVPAREAGRRVAWSLALAALPLAALAFTALRMPLAVNMMHGFRLGTLAMDGVETLPATPPALGWVVAGLGSALGFLALGRLAALHVRGWRP